MDNKDEYFGWESVLARRWIDEDKRLKKKLYGGYFDEYKIIKIKEKADIYFATFTNWELFVT